ncbi:MAG TPA: hypothetical protein VJ826_05010, partial [Candidatus Polarisedimenticolaceae bacterium]|nr:hypothetical protein [Candidatus Polarisedimenticolaceae bacterium]
HFTTASDRAIMAEYATMFLMVNQGQPKRLYFDPANDNWSVFPISARWETGFETPLGEPVDSLTPPKFVYASGTDASGKSAKVYARLFSQDGTQATPSTALVLFRAYQGNTIYDASTAYTVTIVYAPPTGMAWGVMDDTGTVAGQLQLGDSIQLWNPDAVFLLPVPLTNPQFFVSAAGVSSGPGTESAPWSLQYAAAGAGGLLVPGSTVFLRGGGANYFAGATTLIDITVSGTQAKPILFVPFPGEHVVIDGYLTIDGTDVQWWGDTAQGGTIEFFSSDTNRVSAQTLSFPTDLPRANYQMTINGARSKMIHVVCHDLGNGFVPNESAVNAEVYGCPSYNHGWDAPDRGHGHGIYCQSTTAGRKLMRNNLVFNQFDYGMQMFSQATHSDNVTWDSNIAFTNGSLSSVGAGDVTLGTTQNPMQGLVFTGNHTYQPSGALTADIGRNDGPDALNGQVTGNTFAGRVRYKFWTGLNNQNNTFFGGQPQTVSIELSSDETFGGNTWDNNIYWQDQGIGDAPTSFGTVQPAPIGGEEYTFANWKVNTGYDAHSTFTPTAPTGQQVFIQPSVYLAGRGHVAVYNWPGATSASLDLSTILSVGRTYKINHACDPFGTAVLTGTYAGGSVSVPLAATVTPVQPVGGSTNPAPSTAPFFYAFIVRQTS